MKTSITKYIISNLVLNKIQKLLPETPKALEPSSLTIKFYNPKKKLNKDLKKKTWNLLLKLTEKPVLPPRPVEPTPTTFRRKKVKKYETEEVPQKKPGLKRKRRHKERKIFFSYKKAQPYRIRRKKRIKYRYEKRKLRFERHFLNITAKRKNVFLSFYQKIQTKKKSKKRILLLASKTLGSLGYKGRHKSSPLAKEVLGKTVGNSLQKNNLSLIDIIFQKKIGRLYKPILKGLAKNQILIRKLRIKKVHPHGFIRPKKKKRK